MISFRRRFLRILDSCLLTVLGAFHCLFQEAVCFFGSLNTENLELGAR
jgi:hypothetical protein